MKGKNNFCDKEHFIKSNKNAFVIVVELRPDMFRNARKKKVHYVKDDQCL